METINLNFFGEQVTISTPKDLTTLRNKISEKYSLSSSDSAEIILFYTKDSKKIYIQNENDFDKFRESKISTIFLDVNKNSKLYLENVNQIKDEIKKDETKEVKQEIKVEIKDNNNISEKEKQEIISDIEKGKKEIEKLKEESEEIFKKQKEKRKLYDDKIHEIIIQRLELEKWESDLGLECALDMEEFSALRNEKNKKIDEIKKKIEEMKEKQEPKKEEVILKQAKQEKKYWCRSGQNNFPYNKEALRKAEEQRKKYFEKLDAAREKRKMERKALEEKKLLESNNEEILKNMKIDMPGAIPIFAKVNDVLNQTVLKVKRLAREKVMTTEEKEIAKKEEDIKKEKEKCKKEQIQKIQKITREAVNEINNLTKLVIEQSNSLIERINNPQLYKSQSSDNILLRTAPKVEKKEKPEIHYKIICDGCKVTPLRGNRYKCKVCKDFDFCEECYKKNKESHGHDFRVIAHPICRNRLGHPNKKYCQRGIVHSKIMCDGCGMLPMTGWRYKCSICDDYNLCENCEERICHNHPFIKITSSLMLDKFNENYLKLNTYEPNK